MAVGDPPFTAADVRQWHSTTPLSDPLTATLDSRLRHLEHMQILHTEMLVWHQDAVRRHAERMEALQERLTAIHDKLLVALAQGIVGVKEVLDDVHVIRLAIEKEA